MWTTIPGASLTAANWVEGQSTFTTKTANLGGISAKSLSSPHGVFGSTTALYIADYGNNRVLMDTSVPTSTYRAADLELGQPGFVTSVANNQGTPSASNMNLPYDAYSDGTKFYVADTTNNRILIWNSIPKTTGQAANVVVGQPDFASTTANNGGIGSKSLSGPQAVYSDGTKLYVADYNNNRVLIWNSIPTTNQVAANVVLGQPDFVSATANNGGASGSTLSGPAGVYAKGTQLFVSDKVNNRILGWNTIPTTTVVADFVTGQSKMTKTGAGTSAKTLTTPQGIRGNGTNLYVADSANNRVMIWTSLPSTTNTSANWVLGQSGFTTSTSGATSTTFSKPMAVYSDGSKVFVSDYNNNRALVWTSTITVSQQAANLVIGQPSMTSTTANNGGISQLTLFNPIGIYADGTSAWTTDYNNSRILVNPYNAILTISDGPTYSYGFVGMSTSVDYSFTISNIGIGNATSVGAGSPALSAPFSFKGGSYPGTGGTCAGTTINGQASCTIVVTMNPTTEEVFNDTVRVTYSDSVSTKSVSVGVTGTSEDLAVVTLTPASKTFTTIAHGTSENVTFTLTNSTNTVASLLQEGNTALSTGYAYAGGNYPGTGGTCGSYLAAVSSCTLVITFTPPAASTYNSTLSIQYSDTENTQQLTSALTGTGS